MPVDNDWYDDLGEAWWDPTGPAAALHEFNELRVPYFAKVIHAHAPTPTPTWRVLDIGAGGGLLAEALAQHGVEVIGLDRSGSSLASGRERGRADYAQADAEALPFADGSFHAVICSEVIEHVAHPQQLLRECARVLRRRGLFLFSTPNRTWYTRIGLIWLAQRLGWAPHDTHDFDRLIRPGELKSGAALVGLHVREIRGVALRRRGIAAAWGYARRRRTGGFVLSDDQRFSYIGWAVRR